MNAITVTYETTVADCDNTVPWFWSKFAELMAKDKLIGLPAAARLGVIWNKSCEIEDHKVHIYLTEVGIHTAEEDGPPCLFLYVPGASFKLRCESVDVALRAITMCYDRDPEISEKDLHHSKEWGIIASIFGGKVDDKHLIQPDNELEADVAAA
jgi:hypothetical protein